MSKEAKVYTILLTLGLAASGFLLVNLQSLRSSARPPATAVNGTTSPTIIAKETTVISPPESKLSSLRSYTEKREAIKVQKKTATFSSKSKTKEISKPTITTTPSKEFDPKIPPIMYTQKTGCFGGFYSYVGGSEWVCWPKGTRIVPLN